MGFKHLITREMLNKHAEENHVGQSDAPTPFVTSLVQRRNNNANADTPSPDSSAGFSRRRLASTSPRFNRSTLGGQ